MPKLTIDQILQSGIEAHKAGLLKEADHCYTAILEAQPQHPDANHNMGVLAVGVGKVKEALVFFKTALEANPNITQYWLSYIEALIKAERLEDASAVITKFESLGGNTEGLGKLQNRLINASVSHEERSDTHSNLTNILKTLSLNQAIKLASRKTKIGSAHEARLIYQDILIKFPRNTRAIEGLKRLSGKAPMNSKTSLNPSQAELETLLSLYSHGKLQQTLDQCENLLMQHPGSPILFNIQGTVFRGLGQLERSIDAYTKAISIRPDYADVYNNMGNSLKELGKLKKATEAYAKAIDIKSDYVEAFQNMAATLQDQGMLDEAIETYNKALTFKPNNADVYVSLGNALKEQGKLEDAVRAYTAALVINPKYAHVHNNLGNVLRQMGKLEEAKKAYTTALSIKPDDFHTHNNLGNALREQGLLEAAIKAYTAALSLNPDYFIALNNMGIALLDQGRPNEAVDAFTRATIINPDYTETYFNLFSASKSIGEAKSWLYKCLELDPSDQKSRLYLSSLQFYEGNHVGFNSLRKSPLQDHPYVRSFAWVFQLPKLPAIHFHRWALFDDMVERSIKSRPFYEFGVWRAESFKYFIGVFKKGFGFDTFDGLPEDWHDEKAGTYSSNGNIPVIDGGEFVVGKFEDTLPSFFSVTRPKASIINFDADLYSSTICALNNAKPVIDRYTILIFDEFLMNDNWELDECRALGEFCVENRNTIEVLAVSFVTKQVAVRLVETPQKTMTKDI